MQGLPLCVALSLTIIAKRMARRNVLVKNLATIETLGCMSVLCSDKTGTLTMGKMVSHSSADLHERVLTSPQSVQNVAFFNEQFMLDDIRERLASREQVPAALSALQMVARLCNGASFDHAAESASLPVEERPVKGDATDTAVLRFSETLPSMDGAALVNAHERLFEIPFKIGRASCRERVCRYV